MGKKVLIIGAGPAGATLAIYLKRYNIDVLVFDNNKSNLEKAHLIENYYGTGKITGSDLYQKGLDQLNELNIPVIQEEVLDIEALKTFSVKTEKNTYLGDYLVLASGLARRSLNIKGLKEFEGRGISYCATCDSFFFRKKRIGIVGSSKYMESELDVLKRVTDQITIFTNGSDYHSDSFKVEKNPIVEVYGNLLLEGLKTTDKDYKLDGLFIAEGSFNSFAITKHLGINTNSNGEVIVDHNYMTNYPNVFAIGDIIPDIKQVGVAVSHGIHLAYHLFKISKEG